MLTPTLTPALTLTLPLPLTLSLPLPSVENFDELAVKQRLLIEMGGGPGGKYPDLTIADISLEVRRGSVIVSASVRTRSSRVARAASAALAALLHNRAKTAEAFRMPVKSGTPITMPTVAARTRTLPRTRTLSLIRARTLALPLP